MIQNALNTNGELVNIAQANNGISCNLYCSCCGETVIAKQGRFLDWHFAHYSGVECQYSTESELHYLAKKIIEKNKSIKIPCPHEYLNSETDKYELRYSFATSAVTEVYLEKRVNNIVPDVICKIGQSELAIEIFVTHRIDSDKSEKIDSIGIKTLEIDLSGENRYIGEFELTQLLIDSDECYKFSYFGNKEVMYLKEVINAKNKIKESERKLQKDREILDFRAKRMDLDVELYKGKIAAMHAMIFELEKEVTNRDIYAIESSLRYKEVMYRKCCAVMPLAYNIADYFMYKDILICLSDISNLAPIILYIQNEMIHRMQCLKCIILSGESIGFIWSETKYKLPQKVIEFQGRKWDVFGNYTDDDCHVNNIQKSLF